ncbi:MAG TPA: hypothetical protein VHY79_11200 [Rhizomicrobium sp.]|jgi:hypothetical protein|nr:hypothetical protein [Rhizomicrobium sp.]
MAERIEEGFEVFVHDGDVAFGAVREVRPGGRPEIVVYIESAGEFTVPFSAVRDVHDEKVVLDCAKLGRALKEAIGHAHLREDPNVADEPDEPEVES